jgi:hypothetical protein
LERLDLGQEGAEDEVHEADRLGGAVTLLDMETPRELLAPVGRLLDVTGGPSA